MIFIGQHHIMRQLQFLLPALYADKSRSANFLLKGPSGYGKTTMAVSIAHYLAGKGFESYWADWTKFRFVKRVIFIDEVHKIKDLEILYGVMDSKKHVMIFATNHDSVLPEAFVNRCFEYIFTEYSDEELILIARESAKFRASDEQFSAIVEAGNRNPRKIKSLVDRMGIYFQQNPSINPASANFNEILSYIFGIQDGLDTLCRRYLEVLEDVGGHASIILLRNILHVDEDTLKNTIEPVLLQKNLLKITSKGRSLNYDNV